MTTDLTGRVALVTGGGRGIGLEVAAKLSRLGLTVVIGAREPAGAAQRASRARVAGDGAVHTVRLDVTDPESLMAVAGWVGDHLGGLDVLVNNAGIAGDREAQVAGQASTEVVRDVFATNVFGVIAVTETMLPLIRRSRHGRIVNVSSSVGSLTRMSDPHHYFADLPGSLAYPASKSALNQITVQYAKQLKKAGILVNAADPGPCATDFTVGIPGVNRTAAAGAVIIVDLATLPDDGPTGTLQRDTGVVPW